MVSTTNMPTSELAFPPRFWWLKRITIASVVLIVALAGLRWWWGYEAHRRLQTEIDRIIAAGEPIYPEDFDSKNTVPDEENAVTPLDEAKAALLPNTTSEEWAPVDEAWTNPHHVKHLAALGNFLGRERPALEKLHEACSRRKIQWDVQFRSPTYSIVPWGLSEERSLAKLGVADAIYHHQIGDDSSFLRQLQDVNRLAEIHCQYPTIISQLVAQACDMLCINTIEFTLPAVQIANGGQSASRGDVVALLSSLNNDELMNETMWSAIRVERMIHLDIVQQLQAGSLNPKSLFGAPTSVWDQIQSWGLSPLYELDSLQSIQLTSSNLAAVRNGTWNRIQHRKSKADQWSDEIEELLHPLSALSSLDRSYAIHFRVRAQRQMAATALAIRLYQLDHDGLRPKQLAELVPEYLPEMPIDPFSDGKPIGYRPDSDPPYLYTVHEDGIDQGGDYKLDSDGSVDRKSPDWPFFLAPHPKREQYAREKEAREAEEEAKKREAESPQAGENNPDKKTNSGQRDKDQQAR